MNIDKKELIEVPNTPIDTPYTGYKRPLVLLSGGLDSTYVAYQLLQDSDIDVIYVAGNQGPDKIAAEKLALERIYKWLAKHCKNQIITKHYADFTDIPFNNAASRFGQANWWMFAALNAYSEYNTEVAMSYVQGDQINPHTGDIASAWNSLVNFTKIKPIPLTFPLIYATKQKILTWMPETLRNLTWSCELPRRLPSGKFRPCKECVACSTRRSSLFMHLFSNGEIDRLLAAKKKVKKK